ncbi:MAG: radical SAM protein, partial [Clostridia bacterium]|nr:radical SAM protein [Clostridia bacterium]
MICNICPRKCNAIRTDNENIGGFCLSGEHPRIARAGLHYYEEPIISGTNGSGTVFFSGCSLHCVFCQNEKISHGNFGKDISVQRLAGIFRELYKLGAHNINLVTPTHYSYAIKQALDIYRPPIPIIYNTSGYELPKIIKSLEDYVDVYLFDFKYISEDNARRYSKASDYPKYVISSILEAYRQKNECIIDNDLI